MDRAMVTTADRGMATMAAMPLHIMAGTPRTATLPHITAAMDTALFAPHTNTTALGTIAGIVTVGNSRVAIPACGVRIVLALSALLIAWALAPRSIWNSRGMKGGGRRSSAALSRKRGRGMRQGGAE